MLHAANYGWQMEYVDSIRDRALSSLHNHYAYVAVSRPLLFSLQKSRLLSCVAFFALTVFTLNQADAVDSQVFIDLQDGMMYLCLCYVYSHFAENICAKSASLASVICCTNWYEMPIAEQKIIILMVARSQKEYRFQGWGLVCGSLENFLAVCEPIISIRVVSLFICMHAIFFR